MKMIKISLILIQISIYNLTPTPNIIIMIAKNSDFIITKMDDKMNYNTTMKMES